MKVMRKSQLMKYEDFRKLVETATVGTQLRLTFIPDEPEYPRAVACILLPMVDNIITIDEDTRCVLLAVLDSDKWGHNSNRTVVVKFLPDIDKVWKKGGFSEKNGFVESLSGYVQDANIILET